MFPGSAQAPPYRRVVVFVSMVALLAGARSGLAQGTCSNGSPAVAADNRLWGSLRPGDVDPSHTNPAQLPSFRDSTTYTGNSLPGANQPLFSAIDIEENWIFTSYSSGFRIWDAAGVNAENPVMVSAGDLRVSGCNPSTFFVDPPNCNELERFFWDLDAPEGNSDIFAMSGLQPVGMTIIDTRVKTSPRLLYQDTGKGSTPAGTGIYTANLNGRNYAFLAANNGLQQGVFLYDMTAAFDLSPSIGRCAENTNNTPLQCSGVFKGRVGGAAPAVYVDGFRASSGRHFLAISAGGFSQLDKGIELLDVTNPLAPVNVHTSGGRFLTGQISFGVALWQQGSQQFLAVHVSGGGQIYNVTSCLASGCSSLPSPIWTGSWSVLGTNPLGVDRMLVTFSRSNTKPILYFGSNSNCGSGRQREFLFDVTNASSPDEITPDNTLNLDGRVIDYWGWYYSGNFSAAEPRHGFSRVTPYMAKFSGDVLYRVAATIFDTHVWTNAAPTPPIANFTFSPDGTAAQPIYPGTVVTFTDTSSGSVTSRQWTFPGDATPSSTTASPVTATFASPGTKVVMLHVENLAGPAVPNKSQNVTVLNPAATITGVSAPAPASPLTCQAVVFTAQGVTGSPAPTVGWIVRDFGGAQIFPAAGEAAGNPFTLPASTLSANPAGQPYSAVATVRNTVGGVPQSAEATRSFTLTDPPPLDFTSPGDLPLCTNCTLGVPPFGEVQLNASAMGATDYSWDFGDGVFRGFDNGESQFNVANPSFSYSSPGERSIRVKIRNCLGAELISQPLPVNILQIDPVEILTFAAICGAGCQVTVNQPVTFNQTFSGGPTQFEYDWDGDQTFEQSSLTPVTTHTYTTTGIVRPVLRVRRNAETPVTKVHGQIIVDAAGGGGPNPVPSISVIRPAATGQPNQALTFNATASNCTPSPSGWTWTTTGGTGSSTTSSINITWTSTGNKTVTARNSGCGTAQGSTTINIQTGGGGNPGNPGTLAASFTFAPTGPRTGETVTFDGTSSTGSPTVYTWDFGGGVIKTGQTVTHSFAGTGTFPVRLEVGKPGACALGLCTASTTRQVVVTQGGPPPISASFSTSAQCIDDFGLVLCTAQTGQPVTFTDTSTGGAGPVVSRTWNFGDGETASGPASVTHTFEFGGPLVVTLTVGDGTSTSTASKSFDVDGPPGGGGAKTAVLPWTAQTRGALVQSSDLYVHNPGPEATEVTLQFRKRGAPEPQPPTAVRTLQAGATLFVEDVLLDLFDRENVAGLITVSVEGGVEPIITSFNTTFQPDGSQFGQTVPGVSMSKLGAAAARASGAQLLQLVGLNDNAERLAYFGVSNPNDAPATFRLRFFDSQGAQIGPVSEEFTIARFGQRQFQVAEIRERFGIVGRSDYRVEVETTDGGTVVPYASNLRLASDDPSFIIATPIPGGKTYLIGALSQPGLNNSTWVSDVVLANPEAEDLAVSLTFVNVGFNSEPTNPVQIDLEPGQTRRLSDAIGGSWGINAGVGVVTIQPQASQDGLVVQGESYDNTDPKKRFGQTMNAFTDAEAAGQGTSHYLVGLRQDAGYRTTYWIFNPGDTPAQYDLIYLDLDGNEIDRLAAVGLGAGKARQVSPGQHPLPAVGIPGGFTLRILVKSGKVLAGAQVINNLTNDPAYIRGDSR